MAQIYLDRFERIEKERNTIHDRAIGTYTTFEINNEKYFQIDTYGKLERAMPEKISQSFQFDRESAKFLVNLLIKEFNLK